ncbi:MAG TPA: SH3 domain-containing protein [Symbiobacteriaceae bacterium]|nr:SH3 domain-containing protein [Symbiobacteriaceae bacterium]
MRKIVTVFLLLMTLAGCATHPATQGAASGNEPAQVYQAPSPPPAVPARPIEEDLPVPAPLPDGLRRVDLADGQAPQHPGLYFMDVATGKLEGWLAPPGPNNWPAFSLTASEDERWIVASGQEQGYLIRRSDGAAFRYDPTRLILTAGPGVFLARPMNWAPGDGSKCALLDEHVKVVSTFALQDGCFRDHKVLFSPDGKFLAVTGLADGPAVSLVTVATGVVKELGPLSIPTGQSLYRADLARLSGTQELMAALQLSAGGEWPPEKTVVRRYTWQGELRAEKEFPGWDVQPSPDGKLLTFSQSLGLLGQAAVVQEWGADQPLFRVAGGQWPEWLAGGRELAVHSSQGYKLVSTAGVIQAGPPTASGAMFNPFVRLSPAPDDADLFLTNSAYSTSLSLIDRAGRTRRAVSFPDDKLRMGVDGWGPSARSFHFTVYIPGGKGYEGEIWNYIAPKVQRPPFPDKFQLLVEDPKGDCLNLRAVPAVDGKVIRCLSTGTRLDLAKPANLDQLMRWQDPWVWVQVQTDKGETGWVAVNTHSVAYAD